MKLRLGIVMDPIESIHAYKDSSLAMLLAAQARDWRLFYMQTPDLSLNKFRAWGHMQALKVTDDNQAWYELGEEIDQPLAELDVILMRKDPPFDMNYIYSTYILEQAEAEGCLVVNKPSSLRDANEKLFTAWFNEVTPASLVSSKHAQIIDFLTEHRDIIVKPLDGMGGASIFRIRVGDPNLNVILETMTQFENRLLMAQQYIPEISAGDKRILLIDGKPVPFALARIPMAGETRGNLASGGRGESVPLSEHDYLICERVAPKLREKGLIFVGLDVIGNYLTEVNVTSPTCIRELETANKIDIAGQLMDAIEQRLTSKP